ncbi:DUF2785 domain-containing protein [Alicyclobacillus mali (ex Roth et al. 2021)]|uniref:DUF2785 domain-containing protein n=1 Tax=Alicyclobacillus mali (ex Roth et al. 2021) TaxID=1123961 RepID=UPI00082B315F|nr:DUF2785 domain-containing protein [Alicyclobacillus mali (ex Roth et al. 2021)]
MFRLPPCGNLCMPKMLFCASLLDVDLVHGAMARILRYAAVERDRRGFVPGKSWAHTTAHAAALWDPWMARFVRPIA